MDTIKPLFTAIATAVGGDAGLAGILFVLLADKIERAAEAGGVTGREQMFGGRGAGLSRSAHRFRY